MAHIHSMARLGRYQEVAECLAAGADPNAPGRRGAPLQLAAHEGFTDVVRLLLKAGADPNARDRHGHTVLHTAAHHGWVDVAAALLQYGVDPNARTVDGSTPAVLAGRSVKREMVDLLLAHGADPAAKDNQGYTAAKWLAAGGFIGEMMARHPVVAERVPTNGEQLPALLCV